MYGLVVCKEYICLGSSFYIGSDVFLLDKKLKLYEIE